MINDILNDTLNQIGKTIDTGVFVNVEDGIIELKDTSNGVGSSLKESVCAFLNTNGGYVICGIFENERSTEYRVHGFDKKKENELIDLRTKEFKTHENILPDLSDYIDFDYHEFRGKTLAIIHVRPVSEDIKFLKYQSKAYERVLARDKVISKAKELAQQEYKQELEYSKEIKPIEGATLEDLDVDKINTFIIKINETVRKESVKKDIEEAKPFLIRRHCIKDDKITLLGMLLFGKEPTVFLEYRAEVDCFVGDDSSIARDKHDFQDDVLTLITDSFRFIWRHIKLGHTAVNGGQSEPEYPERLIREVINNALAHRDYTINKFITIRVRPNEHLEIKNPGSFKAKMLINDSSEDIHVRRVIPGIPETKNPKLASILKAYDKIESQGIGMATLVGVCLENLIDVPYYEIETTAQMINMVIPSGKLIDDKVEFWFRSFQKYISDKLENEFTTEHKKVLAYFYKSEKLNERRKYTILLSKSNNHFEVIHTLQKAKLIFEHKASRDDTPIYVLDRELLKVDFSKDLTSLFTKKYQVQKELLKTEYNALDAVQKRVLNIIYRNSRYNQEAIKPTLITPEVYLAEYGKNIDPKIYETLGRRVRKICEKYWQEGLLSKDDKTKGYNIDFA